MPSLADDSGIFVLMHLTEILVFIQHDGQDQIVILLLAMNLIEEKLQQARALTPDQRGANFIAVLCLAWPDGHTEFFEGEVEGIVVNPPRGNKGFGYDPIFQPNGYAITFW